MSNDDNGNIKDNPIPQLVMLRADLDSLPDWILPEPYRIRSEVSGDGSAWERIIAESFEHNISYDTMKNNNAYRPERIYFVTDDNDVPVATASAWIDPDFPEDCAALHMVGALQEHTGKHLGTHTVLAAMKQAEKEGFPRMCLKTDEFRIPAIKTYLRLGFQPVVVDERHIGCWNRIFTKIGREDLLPLLPVSYEGKTMKTI